MPHSRSFTQIYSQAPGAVIPTGIRFDDLLYASNLVGMNEQTGSLADGLIPQVEQVLQNMKAMVERAGFTLDNIGRCTSYVTCVEDREPVYGPWQVMYPDSADRPAMKVLVAPLPPGQLVKLDMLAIQNGRRVRLDVPGVPAFDPTVTCGRWVLTSRVHGTDPATGETKVGGPDAELRQAFTNILELVKIAGGDKGDISQITAFMRDLALTHLVLEQFDEIFSAQASRPSLNVLNAYVAPQLTIMLEMTAKI
jgi:2-iminobutanoate/2-iminopropanoate deaminase